MIEKLTNIFVFGTLMRGQRNHYMIQDAQLVKFSGITQNPHFIMQVFNSSTSSGKYTPAISECYSESQGAGYIEGQVYEVNEAQLLELDELEQNGVRYQRRDIELQNVFRPQAYFLITNEEPVDGQDHHINVSEMNFSKAYRWDEKKQNKTPSDDEFSGFDL